MAQWCHDIGPTLVGVQIGSGNGLVWKNNEPLPELMPSYCQSKDRKNLQTTVDHSKAVNPIEIVVHKMSVILFMSQRWSYHHDAVKGSLTASKFGPQVTFISKELTTYIVFGTGHLGEIVYLSSITYRDRVNLSCVVLSSLQWRHIERVSISNHHPHDWLLNRLFRRRSKKTSKLRINGLWIHRWPMNSPHKGPVTRKYFHLVTSPYSKSTIRFLLYSLHASVSISLSVHQRHWSH